MSAPLAVTVQQPTSSSEIAIACRLEMSMVLLNHFDTGAHQLGQRINIHVLFEEREVSAGVAQ